jgi:hypothetical protein
MKYDAFISYNSKDSEIAERIASDLKSVDLNIWFDKWYMPIGDLWLDALQEAISDSSVGIILIGPSGLGKWEKAEVRNFLSNHIEKGRSLIPVILSNVDGTPPLPPFVNQFQTIDLRDPSLMKLDWLIERIRKRKIRRSFSQIGREFTIVMPRSDGVMHKRKLYTFPNSETEKILNLTWDTFGEGINLLKEQIDNYGFTINVDGCFGINDAGLVIATFLNGNIFGRKNVGYIKCGLTGGVIKIFDESIYPPLPENPTILLADFEVKHSNILQAIIKELREKYKNPEFYFAVFGAMIDKPDLVIQNFDELVSANFLKALEIKDFFISGTMHGPGIDPPLGLK